MRKIIIIPVLLLALVSALHGQQTTYRYRWRDDKGLVHYSDSLNNEALKNGYDLVNDQGLTVRHVERPLNASERAAAQKQADLAAEQKRQADEKLRADQILLATYPDENTYKLALKQVLDTLDQQIATTHLNLRSHQQALADLLDRAATDDRNKQPVPKALNDSIEQEQTTVSEQQAGLERLQKNRDDTVKQQAQQLQHFRDLKAAQKTSP